MTINKDRLTYLRCPYCTRFKGGLGIKVPKSIGKYKIMIIHEKILKLKCARCAREHNLLLKNDKQHLWTKMTRKEREAFKKEYYKGGKD